ncbi:hypothetical protein [Streptomyces wuyuanensis]|uniref:hypothetical protein n=1 Tax=Streptomyces wuyuanensis TaxID=1196353 RepID=UPI0036C91006
MSAVGGPVLSAETSCARARFDGDAVTVQRRLAPILPWRPPVTYPVTQVLGAELVWLGGEGERRRFELCLSGHAPTVTFAVPIGRNPHRWPGSSREAQWSTLVGAVNRASGQWLRSVLAATIGTGPWSQEVWHRAETLAPELHVFTEWAGDVSPFGGRTTRSHREVIETGVLGPLRGDAWWSGFRADASPLDRVQAEAWHNLIGLLDPGPLFLGPAGDGAVGHIPDGNV